MVITGQNGSVLQRLSYDAWGKTRLPNGADDPAGAITSQTTRGFTGQEELSVSGLVHLNGRVYDPTFGRMISADPTVPDPLDPQAWNRYSYVGNDPLTFTDPSGFSWLSNFFHDIASFFRSIFANPIVRAIVQIAIAAILSAINPGLAGAVLAAAASAAIVTGLSGGKLADILKAAIIAGVTAFAFAEIGTLTHFHGVPLSQLNASNISNFAANIAGHAAIGCLSAVASGGKCEAGAISAAAGAASAPLVIEALPDAQTNPVQRLEGAAVSGVVGGLASLAGGGKFVDGAVTAAFGYLFNAEALKRLHPDSTYETDLEAGRSLDWWRQQSTDDIIKSLEPGSENPLTVKEDGTIMDGNTRIKVLDERGIDVDSLPRELYIVRPPLFIPRLPVGPLIIVPPICQISPSLCSTPGRT